MFSFGSVRQGVADLFVGQPASGVVNNSLWTLWPEVLCYAALFAFGITRLLTRFAGWLPVTFIFAMVVHLCGPDLIARAFGNLRSGQTWYL